MHEVFITAIVFFGIYHIIKVFTDFLLKKRLINTGHVDKAEILEPVKQVAENSYPTLKWGLVALFAGLGLLVNAIIMNYQGADLNYTNGSYMAFGIELIAISVGFLLYFFFSRKK